jgi:hypothetical protein
MKTDPYEAPEGSELIVNSRLKFENWSDFSLVGLFFLPFFTLALALITSRLTHQLILSGVALSIIFSIGVSLLSAHIHTVRQEAHWGTFALFTFVYLLAQTFALLLCTTSLWVFVTRF